MEISKEQFQKVTKEVLETKQFENVTDLRPCLATDPIFAAKFKDGKVGYYYPDRIVITNRKLK